MQKTLIATMLCAAFAAGLPAAHAQVGKAASEAVDAADHKIEEKRADAKAKDSGPVGKVVNKTKSKYHQQRSKQSAENAKQSLKKAAD